MNLNEMTELETQLRSWALRHPSRGLRKRIFGEPTRTAPDGSRVTFHVSRFTLAWLTPSATALALLCLLVFQRHHPALSPTAHPSALIAMALSNQNVEASVSAVSSNEQYATPNDSLASTNLRPFAPTASPRSLSSSTN